jgi:hypothetical protein
MAQVKGDVSKRGERRGQGVEKRSAEEASHDANRAEDNLPLDAATGRPLEPESRGRLERPTGSDPTEETEPDGTD